MKDFPNFVTANGVASLALKEVPYRQEAYIIIQSSEDPDKLLEECVSFCRVVGAEKVYARGHEFVEQYPIHCTILEMRGHIPVEEEKVRMLWPVTAENIGQWRSLLNEKMAAVDNAATLERAGEKEVLDMGSAYFVHDSGEVLGAGWIVDGELKLIASVQNGMGECVMHTLLSTVSDEDIRIQVASTNTRAIRFYERMGFVATGEISRWYRVL